MTRQWLVDLTDGDEEYAALLDWLYQQDLDADEIIE